MRGRRSSKHRVPLTQTYIKHVGGRKVRIKKTISNEVAYIGICVVVFITAIFFLF